MRPQKCLFFVLILCTVAGCATQPQESPQPLVKNVSTREAAFDIGKILCLEIERDYGVMTYALDIVDTQTGFTPVDQACYVVLIVKPFRQVKVNEIVVLDDDPRMGRVRKALYWIFRQTRIGFYSMTHGRDPDYAIVTARNYRATVVAVINYSKTDPPKARKK